MTLILKLVVIDLYMVCLTLRVPQRDKPMIDFPPFSPVTIGKV